MREKDINGHYLAAVLHLVTARSCSVSAANLSSSSISRFRLISDANMLRHGMSNSFIRFLTAVWRHRLIITDSVKFVAFLLIACSAQNLSLQAWLSGYAYVRHNRLANYMVSTDIVCLYLNRFHETLGLILAAYFALSKIQLNILEHYFWKSWKMRCV